MPPAESKKEEGHAFLGCLGCLPLALFIWGACGLIVVVAMAFGYQDPNTASPQGHTPQILIAASVAVGISLLIYWPLGRSKKTDMQEKETRYDAALSQYQADGARECPSIGGWWPLASASLRARPVLPASVVDSASGGTQYASPGALRFLRW
jgi:hypothetical protein